MGDPRPRAAVALRKTSRTCGDDAATRERVRALLKAYDVRGVPTFIVDGKFLTSARLAGGTQQVIQVVDHLVRLAREERLR